ncbi:UPF0147 family protein [Nanoarchaeota archaeon]
MNVQEVIGALELLSCDDGVPRSVCEKIDCLMKELKSDTEISLIVNRAISDLEEISDDVNIPAFVKTQIWGVLSMLAALETTIIEA